MTGKLTIVETILRDRVGFFTDIRDNIQIEYKIRSMLASSALFLSIYGAVMGASSSLLHSMASLIKLPVLFLLTLAICAPSLHFFNILFGSKQTLGQTIALILTAIATSSVLLLSLAPITLFFLLTGSQYAFFKLLNVLFFGLAGLLGVVFLRQGMGIVTETEDDEGIPTRRIIFALWVLLYGFVGLQMAWSLSPFIGSPGTSFILFRHPDSNVYADLMSALADLFT